MSIYRLTPSGFQSTDSGVVKKTIVGPLDGSNDWHNKQSASQPEYAVTHSDQAIDSDTAMMFALWDQYLSSSAARFLSGKPITLLDIGCGTYQHTPPYAKATAAISRYVGLDPLPSKVQRDYLFINARLEDTPSILEPHAFHVLAFSSVLDHFENIPEVVAATKTMAAESAIACFFIGLHDHSIIAEHYGRHLSSRVFERLTLAHFIRLYFFSLLSLPRFFLTLRQRQKKLQGGQPLDQLHFRYYTLASFRQDVERFGQIIDLIRIPGTNLCFATCRL